MQRLETAESVALDSLWAEETALQLIADVLAAAFVRHGRRAWQARRRNGTEADHADRAEAAKTFFASRLNQRVTLDTIARAVYVSPFHLAYIVSIFMKRKQLGLSHELLDTIYRLLRLLSTPSDIPIFPPSEKRSEFVLKPLDFDF